MVSDTGTAGDTGTTTDTGFDTAGFSGCTAAGQCSLALNGCCAPCGTPKLTDYTPIESKLAEAFRKKVCPDPSAVPCPRCATSVDKSLMAWCIGGACTAIDVRKDAVAECAVDGDCALRTSECCECGGDTANPIAIAVKKLSAYTDKVCAPGTPCADCAPTYPSSLKAVCDPTTKHCVVKGG